MEALVIEKVPRKRQLCAACCSRRAMGAVAVTPQSRALGSGAGLGHGRVLGWWRQQSDSLYVPPDFPWFAEGVFSVRTLENAVHR